MCIQISVKRENPEAVVKIWSSQDVELSLELIKVKESVDYNSLSAKHREPSEHNCNNAVPN